MCEKESKPEPGDHPPGRADDEAGGVLYGGGDPELAALDLHLNLSPETRALLAYSRAFCRRKLLGLPDVLYSPNPGHC